MPMAACQHLRLTEVNLDGVGWQSVVEMLPEVSVEVSVSFDGTHLPLGLRYQLRLVTIRVNHNTIVYQYRTWSQCPCIVPAHYIHAVIRRRPMRVGCGALPYLPPACQVRYHISVHRTQRSSPVIRDVQPALVIGRHYVTERDSAPVQYNSIV